MANLTVYLLTVANLRSVDRHLRYPGELRSPLVPYLFASKCTGVPVHSRRILHPCLATHFVLSTAQLPAKMCLALESQVVFATEPSNVLAVEMPRKIV
jgi:hypothetical protein